MGTRAVVNRDEILVLVEEMDAVVSGKVVDLTAYREVRARLAGAAERHAARLKTIADIADYGRPARDTRRWINQIVANDDHAPEAA